MKNRNPYIMTQPELGKRILELRKSKGLTQEELVEKCNINVRTIQRIEAGEVTPRSFTIKTILEALEVDSNLLFQKVDHKSDIQFSVAQINRLNISWIAGIFFLVLSIVGIIGEIYFWENERSIDQLMYRIPFSLLYIFVLILFIRGYKLLGEHFQLSTLVNAVYAFVAIEVVVSILTIGIVFIDTGTTFAEAIMGLPVVILYGAAELILGMALIKLKNYVGSFAKVLGVLKIVNGAMLISVVLSPIAVFLSIPVMILEIIFLYNLATNSKFHHS